jgi:hypothetical protein
VRKIEKQGTSRHQTVPQNLPYGTSAQSFGLRAQMHVEPDGMMASVASSMSYSVAGDDEFGEEGPSEMLGGYAPSSLVPRLGDFDQEEATGQAFDKSAPAAPQAQRYAQQPPAMASTPMVKSLQAYPSQQTPSQPSTTGAPGPAQGGMPLGGTAHGYPPMDLAKEIAAVHVAPKSRRPFALWMSILFVMIVIALLLWWLVL